MFLVYKTTKQLHIENELALTKDALANYEHNLGSKKVLRNKFAILEAYERSLQLAL